jgi:hypothetical protein
MRLLAPRACYAIAECARYTQKRYAKDRCDIKTWHILTPLRHSWNWRLISSSPSVASLHPAIPAPCTPVGISSPLWGYHPPCGDPEPTDSKSTILNSGCTRIAPQMLPIKRERRLADPVQSTEIILFATLKVW